MMLLAIFLLGVCHGRKSGKNHRNCSFFREKSRSLNKMATSCSDIYQRGCKMTGPYFIKIGSGRKLQVLCDMDTDGGGWTVIHEHGVTDPEDFRCYNNPVIEGRRCRNAVVKANWNSTWQEYENGFGEIPEELGKGDFWLGLKNMHEITREGRGTEARIELYSWGERSWAKYGTFLVSHRDFGYNLTIKNFEDNKDIPVRDAFAGVNENFLCRGNHCPAKRENRKNSRQNGQMFTTKDRDNDNYCKPSGYSKRGGTPEYSEENKLCELSDLNKNCAIEEQSGFWFNSCSAVNLNGPIYRTNPERERQKALPAGMIWATWQKQTSLMFSSIKLRPKNHHA